MPRITISEEDLTLTNNLDVTANVVYVPGIAKQGPVNVPILCETLSDFTKTFGNEPYKFVSNQSFNGSIYAQQGEYEKSYIYACELLNLGMHVMFERVVDQVEISTILITAKQETASASDYMKYYVITEAVVESQTALDAGTYYIASGENGYVLAKNYVQEETYYKIEKPSGAFDDQVVYYSLSEEVQEDANLVSAIYNSFNPVEEGALSIFNKLQDRWTYNIKFITSGSYPVTGVITAKTSTAPARMKIVENMCMIATVRGDAVALIDHEADIDSILTVYDNINELIDGSVSTYYTLDPANGVEQKFNTLEIKIGATRKKETTLKYAALFAPWCIFNMYSANILALPDHETCKLPGSFDYLLSLGYDISAYGIADYQAIAGITRGLVPHLAALNTEVTGSEADAVQVRVKDKVSINPIVYVQNYGNCIWGNRTLFPNVTSSNKPEGDLAASSFLNVRVLASDVKKVIYAACQKYTFETNTTELWLKFKSEIEPTLEKMVANGALEDFELTKLSTTEKATLSVYVRLVTLYAVEDFDVTIGLTDSTVEMVE